MTTTTGHTPTPIQIRIQENHTFAKGGWGGEFHPDFIPRHGDVVIKEHWTQSGFANTDLDFQLKQRGITHVNPHRSAGQHLRRVHRPLRRGTGLPRNPRPRRHYRSPTTCSTPPMTSTAPPTPTPSPPPSTSPRPSPPERATAGRSAAPDPDRTEDRLGHTTVHPGHRSLKFDACSTAGSSGRVVAHHVRGFAAPTGRSWS